MIAQRYTVFAMNARGEDPLVRTLRLKERAEEDIYFAARDRRLIADLHAAQEEERLRHAKEGALPGVARSDRHSEKDWIGRYLYRLKPVV